MGRWEHEEADWAGWVWEIGWHGTDGESNEKDILIGGTSELERKLVPGKLPGMHKDNSR